MRTYKFLKILRKIGLQGAVFGVFFVAISLFQIRHHIPHSEKAPLISGQTKDGSFVSKDLSDFAPARTTLVYFFAPWCGVCKISMGNLNFIANFASIHIVSVALDFDTPSEVIDFVGDKELSAFELILGDNATGRAYRVDSYPTYYVVSEKGEIVTSSVGYSSTIGMILRIWLAQVIG